MSRPILAIDHLSVTFKSPGHRSARFVAVDDVSLTIGQGETLGVVGESGSGKSTIGRAILGLVRPSAGSITFDGRDLTDPKARDRVAIARDLQAVFQDPNGSLNPLMTIGQILAEPLRVQTRIGNEAAAHRVRDLLDGVGLPADAGERYPSQFSGGQRQRIAIARALALDPKLIVCDEPVSALDLSTQAQVLNLLRDLRTRSGLAYLFISHDLSVIRFLSHRIVVVYHGQVMETGPAATVSDEPAHPYTIALSAAAPVVDVDRQARRRAIRRSAITDRPKAAATVSSGCPFAARCPYVAEVCLTTRPRLVDVGDVAVACHVYDPRSGHPRTSLDRRIGFD